MIWRHELAKSDCEALRREIKLIAERLWTLRHSGTGEPSEAYANAHIAYLHLQDASMRLGKAIQAIDGGISVCNKDQVPESISP